MASILPKKTLHFFEYRTRPDLDFTSELHIVASPGHGQNLFDDALSFAPQSWRAALTAEKLIGEGRDWQILPTTSSSTHGTSFLHMTRRAVSARP